MSFREYATKFINEILSQKRVWRMEGVSDLTQQDFTDKIGVAFSTVNRWES